MFGRRLNIELRPAAGPTQVVMRGPGRPVGYRNYLADWSAIEPN
jgi:hypothetical protein